MPVFRSSKSTACAAILPFAALWSGVLHANAAESVATGGSTEPRVELSVLLLSSSAAEVAGSPSITIGLGQDIVGAPIDFARMPKPVAPGGLAGKLRQLPGAGIMPTRLPISNALLTSRYGMRWHPIRGGYRSHSGIDLAAPAGSPILAPAAGIVSAAGWDGGYGLSATIEHGGGLQTRYGHMSRLGVMPGQSVASGTVIGYVGSTGLSTGPHLHYEVRSGGRAVDPLSGR